MVTAITGFARAASTASRSCMTSVPVSFTLSRALLASAFACAVAVASSGAQAQTADECASKPTPAEEIACLRGALKEKTDALERAQSGAAPAPGNVAQPVQSVQASPAVPAGAKAVNPADDLGREQLASTRENRDAAPAKAAGLQTMVFSVTTDREGLFRIKLENGQVWKQAERPSVPIPIRSEQRYPVEITKSGFGGYRMYFPDLGRTMVVKRVL